MTGFFTHCIAWQPSSIYMYYVTIILLLQSLCESDAYFVIFALFARVQGKYYAFSYYCGIFGRPPWKSKFNWRIPGNCNITRLLVRNKQMNNKSHCKRFPATQASSRMGELHHDCIRGLENMKGILELRVKTRIRQYHNVNWPIYLCTAKISVFNESELYVHV